MANRSGVPFTVMRQMDEGECFLTIRHINDGEEGLPIRCSDPDAEDEMALRQLHMQGPKPIN